MDMLLSVNARLSSLASISGSRSCKMLETRWTVSIQIRNRVWHGQFNSNEKP